MNTVTRHRKDWSWSLAGPAAFAVETVSVFVTAVEYTAWAALAVTVAAMLGGC